MLHRLPQRWPVGVGLMTAAVLATGCNKNTNEQDPPITSAAPTASSAVAAAASGAAPKSTDPRAKEQAPWAWESAYQLAIGPNPVLCGVTSAAAISGSTGCKDRVELPYSMCSNVDARKALEKQHKDAFAKRKVSLQKEAARREKEEAAVWLPKKQAWLEHKKSVDEALGATVLLRTPPASAKVPASYGAPGTSVDLQRADDANAGAQDVRKALAPYSLATAPIECDIKHVARIPRKLDPREAQHAVASGEAAPDASQSDIITCWFETSEPNGIALVLELPVAPVRAKLTVERDKGKIEGYEPAERVADEGLATRLSAIGGAELEGAKIRIQGIRRLQRFAHGAIAYKHLKDRGLPTQMAIKTAEYKQVWIASFERACPDAIGGCPHDDGLDEPRVSLVRASSGPSEPAPKDAPADNTGPTSRCSGRGLWEDAACAVDPEGKQSVWKGGFFIRAIDKAASLDKLSKPGEPAKISTEAEPTPEPVARFRDEVKRLGGVRPFSCRVLEIGQEPNAPASPVLDAALEAHGQTGELATQMQILCRGDQDSFDGPVLLFVPSYAAWAEVEGEGDAAKVKGYHLEKLGWFDPWLRSHLPGSVGIADDGATGDILHPGATTGQPPSRATGTVLRVAAVTRLARRTGANVAFGQSRGDVMWYASLGKMQCPHSGLGCEAQDGVKAPAIETVRGVPCDPEQFSYPPMSGAVRASIVDEH